MPATTKQRGYRVKISMFIPCDHKDIASLSRAIEFARAMEAVPEGAPEGTLVETFSASPARRETTA